MTENLNLGIQLLIVGMISVFFILGIVVAIGKILIFLVNKYSPSEYDGDAGHPVSKRKVAVISAVVQLITDGKGVVSSINKL